MSVVGTGRKGGKLTDAQIREFCAEEVARFAAKGKRVLLSA